MDTAYRAVVFDCFGVLYTAGPNAALLEYVRSLRPTYKLGLLSNITSESLAELFPDGELEGLFDAFVLSGDVGIWKPDPRIFTRACHQLGVVPAQAIMVDDQSANIAAARIVGMESLLYRGTEQCVREITALLRRM